MPVPGTVVCVCLWLLVCGVWCLVFGVHVVCCLVCGAWCELVDVWNRHGRAEQGRMGSLLMPGVEGYMGQ